MPCELYPINLRFRSPHSRGTLLHRDCRPRAARCRMAWQGEGSFRPRVGHHLTIESKIAGRWKAARWLAVPAHRRKGVEGMFMQRMRRRTHPTRIRAESRHRARHVPLLRLTPLLCLLVSGAASLRAETPGDDLRAMRLEIERLRAEVDVLKKEVRRLKDTPRKLEVASNAPAVPAAQEAAGNQTASSPAQDQTAQPSAEEAIPLLQAQVAEQAQTKVESNSRMPVFFSTSTRRAVARIEIPSTRQFTIWTIFSGGSFRPE